MSCPLARAATYSNPGAGAASPRLRRHTEPTCKDQPLLMFNLRPAVSTAGPCPYAHAQRLSPPATAKQLRSCCSVNPWLNPRSGKAPLRHDSCRASARECRSGARDRQLATHTPPDVRGGHSPRTHRNGERTLNFSGARACKSGCENTPCRKWQSCSKSRPERKLQLAAKVDSFTVRVSCPREDLTKAKLGRLRASPAASSMYWCRSTHDACLCTGSAAFCILRLAWLATLEQSEARGS